MGFKIRQGDSHDLNGIRSLAEQLVYPGTEEEFASRFEKMSGDHRVKQWIASSEDTNAIVGWVQACFEVPTLLSDQRGEVSALIVDRKIRNSGVGRALLVEAENWFKSQGIQTVRVRSNVARADAHQFYGKCGYNIQKTWYVFKKEL